VYHELTERKPCKAGRRLLSGSDNSRRGSEHEQQTNRTAEKPEKEAMSLRSEQEANPRRGSDEDAAVGLRHR
jgi:hypothetical protein